MHALLESQPVLHRALVHMFIERKNYNGPFMPGFKEWKSNYNPVDVGLLYVDHCVGNVELGKMNEWVGFYERVLGASR